MDGTRVVDAVVFDVLGTMVDEPTGLRAAIAEAVPNGDEAFVEALLDTWQQHVESAQNDVAEGRRQYAISDVVDAEAARSVAERAGITDGAVIARLAAAGRRLPAWADSVAGLDIVARRVPVLALSNASRSALLAINAHAGLRWHHALSAESVGAYKPSPEVYRLASDVVGRTPDRLLMVAAHAWDLRGAQAVGMRTAYVQRPTGDPPTHSDRFDWHFKSLAALGATLAA